MTLHINYTHQCPKCGAYYLPYDRDVPCPKCGLVEEERFDFVSPAVESVLFNLAEYRSYVPPAWWTGSLADKILLDLFMIFEKFEKHGKSEKSEKTDFKTYVGRELEKWEWGDQTYLKNHVYGIAIRVREEIEEAGKTGKTGRAGRKRAIKRTTG